MNHKSIIIVVFLALSAMSNGQSADNINVTDRNGLKQGHWIKKYPDNNIMYEGFFTDDHPVGEFKRFYTDKTLKSVLIYSTNGKEANAEIYHANGNIASKGKYFNQLKEGKWQFYSEIFKGYLIVEENYTNNQKNGLSTTFFPDGKVAEKVFFINDVKHGEWIKYYPDGKLCLRSQYVNGKVNGKFEAWHENGKIQFSGEYKKDLRNGTWLIYDKNGGLKYKLNYIDGITEDHRMEIDESAYLDSLELNKGKIADPEKSGILK